MRRTWVIAGAVALIGCTASAALPKDQVSRSDRELADALKGRVAGEATDCIEASNIDGPQIIDNKTILYRNGRTVWRMDLATACPGLAPMTTIVVERYGSQICRHDRFRTLSPGTTIPGAYCLMGKFTPYRK